jgi:hypothetical protein
MNLLIEHTNGQITQVTFATVIANLCVPVTVATDPARAAAYLTANAGQSVAQSVYEKQTAIQEKRLLILTADGTLQSYPATTLLLKASKFNNTLLIDLAQHWRSGKYSVDNNTLIPAPNWQEPTITLPPLDAPAP